MPISAYWSMNAHSKWPVKVPRVCSYTLGYIFSNLVFQSFQDMGPESRFGEGKFQGGSNLIGEQSDG